MFKQNLPAQFMQVWVIFSPLQKPINDCQRAGDIPCSVVQNGSGVVTAKGVGTGGVEIKHLTRGEQKTFELGNHALMTQFILWMMTAIVWFMLQMLRHEANALTTERVSELIGVYINAVFFFCQHGEE